MKDLANGMTVSEQLEYAKYLGCVVTQTNQGTKISPPPTCEDRRSFSFSNPKGLRGGLITFLKRVQRAMTASAATEAAVPVIIEVPSTPPEPKVPVQQVGWKNQKLEELRRLVATNK